MSIYQEEHLILQQSLRRFAAREILPFIETWEDKKYFPSEIFEKLGNAGFLGVLLNSKWGGVGGDYLLAGAWCEEFGRIPSVGFTTGVNMHSLVVCPTLERFGSSEAKEQWLQKAAQGKAIGAYAFTEPGAGSDLTQIQTRAVLDGNEWILNGAKTFITNGERAHFILALAKTNPKNGYDGYTTFVIDTSLPGFQVTRTLSKLGWHSSDTAELSFSEMRLPKYAVLGEVGRGWHQAMTSLEWERLMLSLGALAGASACLDATLPYIRERKVFGRSISSFNENQHQISLLWSKLQSARSYAHHCLHLLSCNKRCRKEVSLLKYSSCELAIQVADTCLQLHGGYGYTTEFSPERWLRDLRLNTIGGGTNEVMKRIAAKEVF